MRNEMQKEAKAKQNKAQMAQIIASQTVKPSSPTPSSSRKYKLSSIDQISPPVYIPLIFFYESDQSKLHEQISRCLKKSLSEALAIFYPLAGAIKQNSFVDCNDGGVEMVEARIGTPLSRFIQNPSTEELRQLLPAGSAAFGHDSAAVLSLKTSYFDCGGIAVGVCFSHKVGDGASAVAFMNAWAATCRGEVSRIVRPAFDLAVRLPPREETAAATGFGIDPAEDELVTERLVFDGEKLEKLRREASDGEVKNPSRVEAVSAFIWRSFIEAATKRSSTAARTFAAAQAVDLRPRAVPSFPNQTFGNCFTFVYANISPEEDDGGMGVLVSKMRAPIRGVDEDYVNRIAKDEVSIDEAAGDMSELGNCVFTSWWRFPVYEVDFGWGKPVWVGTAAMPASNTIVLMATPCREGMEAWVNLSRHNQDSFESLRANYAHLFN